MPQAVVEELDLADKAAETCLRKDGWWASKALSPALQLYGPALPPALSHDATAMWHKMQTKRPSDVLACENMHGRRVNSKPATDPTLWWQTSDLPAFVMQPAAGPDVGGGRTAYMALPVRHRSCTSGLWSSSISSVDFDVKATFTTSSIRGSQSRGSTYSPCP